MTDITITVPAMLELSDDLNEARTLLYALELAIAGLHDGDDRDALAKLTELVGEKLKDVAGKLDGLINEAK